MLQFRSYLNTLLADRATKFTGYIGARNSAVGTCVPPSISISWECIVSWPFAIVLVLIYFDRVPSAVPLPSETSPKTSTAPNMGRHEI